MSERRYEIMLLGAGYTGSLCADYIATHLPTNLRWAIAGRSTGKIEAKAAALRTLSADRVQPDVLQVELNPAQLEDLARRTRVLLNCIGPYTLYGTPIVEACAKTGTHYLDVTGETLWVRQIVSKYHEVAKRNDAIIIPEIGVESAASDLVAFLAASQIRNAHHCGTRDVVCSVHEIKSAGPSGGTLSTAITVMDHYSISELQAASQPFVLSPSPPTKRSSTRSLLSRIFGTFHHPDLGILTTSIMAAPNVAIVHRSSGLMPELYGESFSFAEYLRVSGYLVGTLIHFGILTASLLLLFSPVRWLLKRFIYQPGQGPAAEKIASDVLECRAVAIADQDGPEVKAMARFRYDGGIYYLTGLFMAEAAMIILQEPALVQTLRGGVLTPACLGEKFVERLRKAGVQLEAEMMGSRI